ncbi:calcium-binding protein PBP1-like [Andrographis paniculata]|uniref:calcium-binding protein PBP1-like n=1 Tax=Andrographis paniculata TaxID=175694 RepID=UPI0021E98AA8|nr:calcium-binding protein PBP1-like [Andrographis paniculata]
MGVNGSGNGEGRGKGKDVVFEDYFPAMVEKLGAEGFMSELCKGFRLLMDREKGVITLESLRRNSAVLGVEDAAGDEELLRSMLREGDLDGDGCLNQKEFCVLMFRLSPHLLAQATSMLLHHHHH